jgi:carbonic anhydrase/acetyltransferase-like protein (isoleucine patch superfamily)
LHGCTIRDESLVGIGATVLDGALIGDRSILGAGCLIPPGTKIPPESFVVGLPGRVTRNTSSSDLKRLEEELKTLSRKAALYRAGQEAHT